MSLQRKTQLESLTITFSDGKYVTAEPVFAHGVWDTDLKGGNGDWTHAPELKAETLTTVTADGRKKLNDVLGIAAVKALEEVESARKVASDIRDAYAALDLKNKELTSDLSYAKGASINYAKLEKATRAELIIERQTADTLRDAAQSMSAQLMKIRRLTFGLLGR